MEEILLPQDYEPFQELVICGNSLVNGQVPISVDGHAVFLLGKGNEVKVWLQVPTGKEWRYEIVPDQPGDSAYKVKRSGNSISVYFGHHLILRAEKITEDKAIIDHLDLTTFGLAIHGDPTTLWVGRTELSGNSFDGVRTMVAVG